MADTRATLRVIGCVLQVLALACTPTALPAASPAPPTHTAPGAATVPPALAAPEATGCPVTLPATGWIAELTGFSPLPASRYSWYGDTDFLAVDLPVDGVYRIQADEVNLNAKIAWWRYVDGTVEITAGRVDGSERPLRTTTTAGYGDRGFNPSGIQFTSEGCWRVTGALQGRQLSFVMLVLRARPTGN